MIYRPEEGWQVEGVMTHPGAVLREDYMIPLGLAASVLAERLHITADLLQQIIEERTSISAETALRLARCFRGTPDVWMNLQAQHDLSKARLESGSRVLHEVQPLDSIAA